MDESSVLDFLLLSPILAEQSIVPLLKYYNVLAQEPNDFSLAVQRL